MRKKTIKQQVEDVVKNAFNSTIYEWITKTRFVDTHGCDGYVFNTQEAARRSVLRGNDHQNALDYVEGAMSDDEWRNYLKASKVVTEEEANDIVNHGRWNDVVKIIVATCGPEWFLSTYSGTCTILENGKLLYY
jgi:hypothetical protein